MTWGEILTALRDGPLPAATRRAIAKHIEPFAKAEMEREAAQKAAGHDPNDPCCECGWCWSHMER
jgi:hypothetical protein